MTTPRNNKGQFLERPPGAAPPITSANAREMVRRRVEKYRRAALGRVIDEAKSIDPTVSVGADAFALATARQYTALLDSDKPRMHDLMMLRDLLTGHVSDGDSRRANERVPSDVIVAQPAALAELVRQIEELHRDDIAKRNAIDADAK